MANAKDVQDLDKLKKKNKKKNKRKPSKLEDGNKITVTKNDKKKKEVVQKSEPKNRDTKNKSMKVEKIPDDDDMKKGVDYFVHFDMRINDETIAESEKIKLRQKTAKVINTYMFYVDAFDARYCDTHSYISMDGVTEQKDMKKIISERRKLSKHSEYQYEFWQPKEVKTERAIDGTKRKRCDVGIPVQSSPTKKYTKTPTRQKRE
ncbi:uncharacterized protein LOC131944394 [Physella acuta]|uniref:uncharacterized protein LOC131944394 n=1 Tax=Physella acuta TaxID=109671 RepID=UPI0027DD749F|nr:uncharacterized protein LOC131944394 [Physella acuta]